MTYKIIERYLNTVLKPELDAHELQDAIIFDIIASIRPQKEVMKRG